MNKRALEDEETQKYKIDKEKQIGSSNMVSTVIGMIISILVFGTIIIMVMAIG
ncbi:hypothetical protein [Agathobacter ruminis]|uniref:hypothetical protein n=1 Tax=Agathobacter ruminis TaxID=1712665 RepID=UPI0016709BC7|nr:hypothetical protein [Agathobacter ruminis]MBQ5475292.1 hypothetical protein [Lachnospiraceae bacterium]MDC7301554.1 hypothetical protein [Agathobacter ruminis]